MKIGQIRIKLAANQKLKKLPEDMMKKTQVLWSQKLLIATAFAERLDEFGEIGVFDAQKVDYYTVHGWRTLSFESLELNQFYVFKTGDGFAKAVGLPCECLVDSINQIPQLIVEYFVPDAAKAGYARAVKLPYYIADNFAVFPAGTLVVSLIEDNCEAMDAGYRNAISLPGEGVSCSEKERSEIYMEDLKMLDTDYAAMLLTDSPESPHCLARVATGWIGG